MQVQDILKTKGSAVKSVRPTDRVQTLARRLAEDKVGAMVVIGDTGTLDGIVSERDIARALAAHGCELLDKPVSEIMTTVVITCAPKDSLYGVAKLMTTRRIRHVPVSDNGQLVGLVSIGDVLNHRLEELQLEANVLRDYAIALR
ncbi:MAG: CBS domain-containing protein [Hyphomicrobium sp.]